MQFKKQEFCIRSTEIFPIDVFLTSKSLILYLDKKINAKR